MILAFEGNKTESSTSQSAHDVKAMIHAPEGNENESTLQPAPGVLAWMITAGRTSKHMCAN